MVIKLIWMCTYFSLCLVCLLCLFKKNPKLLQRLCGYIFYNPKQDLTCPLRDQGV